MRIYHSTLAFLILPLLAGAALQSISQEPPVAITDILEVDGTVFVATAGHGVRQSSDQARTWLAAPQGLPDTSVVSSLFFAREMTVSESSSLLVSSSASSEKGIGTLFAGTRNRGLYYALYDTGRDSSTNKPIEWISFTLRGLPEGVAITDIAIDARGHLFLATEKHGVYLFRPFFLFGLSMTFWSRIDPVSPGELEVLQLATAPQDATALYVATRNRVLTYTSEGLWDQLLDLKLIMINTISIPLKDSEDLYLGSDSGLFVWRGKTGRSQPIFKGPEITTITNSDGSTLHVGTATGMYYSYSSRDASRQESGLIAPVRVLMITALQKEPPMLLAGTAEGLYTSTDGGRSWQPSLFAPRSPWPTPPLAVGSGITIFGIATILLFLRRRKKLQNRIPPGRKDDVRLTGDPATQIREAFDSLKRSETLAECEEKDIREIYVDYRQILDNVLQKRDDYIVGPEGVGKTTLLLRSLLECRQISLAKEPSGRKPFATYISMKAFELEDLLLKERSGEIERRFAEALQRSIGQQRGLWPTRTGKAIAKSFPAGNRLRHLEDFSSRVLDLQQRDSFTEMFLLVDDYSCMDYGLQEAFGSIFRRFILSSKDIFMKIAVIDGKFDLGEIEKQRDMFELPLGIAANPEIASESRQQLSDAVVATRKIIDRRLGYHSRNGLSIRDVFPDHTDEILRMLLISSAGTPRTMGVLLSLCWKHARTSGRSHISREDVQTICYREKKLSMV